MEQIVYGNLRVQLLNKYIVRAEYAKNGKFCDENTFFIPNKTDFTGGVLYTQKEGVICFDEYELYLPQNATSLKGMRLEKSGKKIYTYRKLANSGELPPLDKTPKVFAISDTPRILIPEGGYSKDRNGEYSVEENVEDIYLLLCEGNAKKLRKLYVDLTGRSELVRLSTLGSWNSKYYAYTEEEAKQVILDYEAHDVPLDNMVIDTDWRDCKDGWGYDVNMKLFPDMKRFLEFAHAHDVEIMFNDHPEPVEGTHVFKPKEIAYRERNLQSIMTLGLDTWWYDRNWSSHLVSPTENIRWETFGLYLFADITNNFYQRRAKNKLIYRRPVIMGNVVNVDNGRYEKICDSASHRYSIQWTGDITCDFKALSQEVATMIKATNNGVAYCNADCGGHLGNPNKEEFIRWMQFGTLSPVFRPHCTNTVERFREPWIYDGETLDIVREYINLRYRLLTVIYKSAYESYESGEPIFKAVGWNYPKDKKALKRFDEYMLGTDILIRPIGETIFAQNDGKVSAYLPEGKWMCLFDGKIYMGHRTIRKEYALREMPLFVRLGALIPLAHEARNTKKQKWDKLVYDFYPCKEATDEGYLYEDDTETTAYKQGMYRKSSYKAAYCGTCNSYVVNLYKTEGTFSGEKCFKERKITFKVHLLNKQQIRRITVNGEEVAFKVVKKDVSAFPLNADETAPDSDTLLVNVLAQVEKDYEIKFYL